MPREQFQMTYGVFGPIDESVAEHLRRVGVAVHALPIRHFLDMSGAWRLRQVIQETNPKVIHAWGPMAARLTRLAVVQTEAGNMPRLVVSAASMPGSGFGGWLATRMIRRADRVVAATWGEAEQYRRLRVATDRLTRITPASTPPAALGGGEAVLRSLGIPVGARVIVTGAAAEAGIGPREAIVAFDMLRYEAADLYLIVCGAGPQAGALEQFGRSLAFDDFRVRFAPPDARAAVVQLAVAVWVTAPYGGYDEALEGMAASKPVIGWETADLAEVVEDGVTGFLVPVGDRAAMAEKARRLLIDPDAAARMGAAGHARAAERFTPARLVEKFARVYQELACV